MTSTHPSYENNPLQHAHDIAFATFRVAALIKHPKLKSEIEHAAVDLVSEYDLIIIEKDILGYGQKLQALIQLAESVGHIHSMNASVLLREINNLQSAIGNLIKNVENKKNSFDLKKIFKEGKKSFLSSEILDMKEKNEVSDLNRQSVIGQRVVDIKRNIPVSYVSDIEQEEIEHTVPVLDKEDIKKNVEIEISLAESKNGNDQEENIVEETDEEVAEFVPATKLIEEKKIEFHQIMDGRQAHDFIKKEDTVAAEDKPKEQRSEKKIDRGSERVRESAEKKEKSIVEKANKSDNKKSEEERSFSNPDERQGAILQFIRKMPNGCRMRDLVLAFPEVSERTLRNDLQALVSEHAVERFGSQGPFSYFRAVTKSEVFAL